MKGAKSSPSRTWNGAIVFCFSPEEHQKFYYVLSDLLPADWRSLVENAGSLSVVEREKTKQWCFKTLGDNDPDDPYPYCLFAKVQKGKSGRYELSYCDMR